MRHCKIGRHRMIRASSSSQADQSSFFELSPARHRRAKMSPHAREVRSSAKTNSEGAGLDRETKARALRLLGEKAARDGMTYSDSPLETGHSERQAKEARQAALRRRRGGHPGPRQLRLAAPQRGTVRRGRPPLGLQGAVPERHNRPLRGHLHRWRAREPGPCLGRRALRAGHAEPRVIPGALHAQGLALPRSEGAKEARQ